MNASKFMEQKNVLFQTIQNNLDSWEGTSEDAIRILEANEKKFVKLKEIDEQLSSVELEKFQKQHAIRLQKIIELQSQLMEAINVEKIRLKDQLGQLGKKNKVVSNYISMQKKSLFVEKNY